MRVFNYLIPIAAVLFLSVQSASVNAQEAAGRMSPAGASAYADAYANYWQRYYEDDALDDEGFYTDDAYVDTYYGDLYTDDYAWTYDYDQDTEVASDYQNLMGHPPVDVDYWDREPWEDPDMPNWFDGENWASGYYDYDQGYKASAYDEDTGYLGAPADFGAYRYRYFDEPHGRDYYDVSGIRDSYDIEPFSTFERDPYYLDEYIRAPYERLYGRRLDSTYTPRQLFYD